MIDPRMVVLTPEEIAQVREAIRKAKVDSARYARDSRPDPERMRTPLGPPGGNWGKWMKERQLLNDDVPTRAGASSGADDLEEVKGDN